MIYSAKEIRESFLSFFNNKNHFIMSGSSVIPEDDNTLLFTNAGMNQFKNYFVGSKKSQYDPIATAQRCIRAGGKHNDLDQVGFTSRHLTHFWMLGNFSFGAYFKAEAISYAWEYLTQVLKLDKDKLWITVYEQDEEAYFIWLNKIGIHKNKISKLNEKDNFWQMGDFGPCGPCSEIYYDRGIKNDDDLRSFPSDSQSERFLEIWNLVFIEYEKKLNGNLEKLSCPGIDTGMGLERLASVIQNKDSIYQIDIFVSLIKCIEKITNINYKEDNKVIFHVLCDHVRTAALVIANDIIPSNESRGYVLRKIIRRALLFSKKIYNNFDLLAQLSNYLIESPNSLYGDLKIRKDYIYDIILEESKKFFTNIDDGVNLFDKFLKKQNNNIFSGKDAFILYDTYGFPLEITEILAGEKNMIINKNEYELEMLNQQEKSKKNKKFITGKDQINTAAKTEFIGYNNFICDAIILEIYVENSLLEESMPNKDTILIFDKTVFYGGGGGQIADKGTLLYNNHKISIIEINKYGDAIGVVVNSDIIFTRNTLIKHFVEIQNRIQSSKSHSAVHLLHRAIELYFKDNTIYQNGSYVCSDYFTIDIVMKHDVSYQDKKNIELIVNAAINENYSILEKYMTLDEAIKNGATAQFMEKYNKDNVRVIDIENFAIDLCGGCHAKKTKDLGFFILKEVISAKAGTKRFVGLVGDAAFNYIRQMEEVILKVKQLYSCPVENIIYEIDKKNLSDKNIHKSIDKIKIEYACDYADLINLKNKNKAIVFEELSPSLKLYEKYIIEKIEKAFILCCLYFKKDNNYIVYIKLDKEYYQKNKDIIIDILKNKCNFKGNDRNGILQGTMKVIDKISFFSFFKDINNDSN